MPDPVCNPGLWNPAVTQATIGTTICLSGWTATIRPPSSYTDHLKLQQLVAYGQPRDPTGYEEDHLVSLELGGHPTDPRNLWPEAYATHPGAHEKDRLENALHARVCAGSMLLDDARRAISENWITAYVQYVGPLP